MRRTRPRRLRSGGFLAALGVAGLLSWLTTAPASAAPTCQPSGTNIVCSFTTPGADTFTIPPGVTQVTVDAYGAQGGAWPSFSTGGLGGQATATFAVVPGAVWQVNVGGVGGPNVNVGGTLPNGGVNGGGSGGTGNGTRVGPGGGGASDIRTGSFRPADRILVAGGGGGAGSGVGGAGGGLNGR